MAADNRRALADALSILSADQWRSASLCAGWTAAPDLVAVLRANADTPWSPPGGGLTGALTHDVIHGPDIAWPLGIAYDVPPRATTTVLDSLTSAGSRTLFGFPLDGIRVTATDLDWSSGQGAELAGRSRT